MEEEKTECHPEHCNLGLRGQWGQFKKCDIFAENISQDAGYYLNRTCHLPSSVKSALGNIMICLHSLHKTVIKWKWHELGTCREAVCFHSP